MKFIIRKGCPLFDQLTAVWAKCEEANKYADDLAKEFGAAGIAKQNSGTIGGNIGAFHFPDRNPPEKWKAMEKGYTTFYMPKAELKDVNKRVNDRPRVRAEEMQEILNFHNQGFCPPTGGLAWCSLPNMKFFPEYILVYQPEGTQWTDKPDGLEEILGSEYEKLLKESEVTSE